jgi:hypothetical protein
MGEEREKFPLHIFVYVIMPFSETKDGRDEAYWNEHFEHFIKEQIKEVKPEIYEYFHNLSELTLDIKRSSVEKGGPLNNEIIWDLMRAGIVIADITDLNPNMMYELGIRHALSSAVSDTRTVIIQEEDLSVPFDFANYAVVEYNKNRIDSWRENIKKRLMSCIEDPEYGDNPVSATFANRNISFSLSEGQTSDMEQAKFALKMLDKMVNDLDLDKDWVQDFFAASFLSENPNLREKLEGVSLGKDNTLIDTDGNS